jgi:hypothetical protein
MIASTEGTVNKTILICVAIASFAATVLWLHQPSPSEPAHVLRNPAGVPRSAPVAISPAAEAPQSSVRALQRIAKASPEVWLTSDVDPADQEELAEYVGGLSHVAPVKAEQQRAILEAKARHRHVFATALRDSGLERPGLSLAEREYAHRTLARALEDAREGFLLDVKPVLDDEQFALLSNFEATESKRRLEALQIQINAK